MKHCKQWDYHCILSANWFSFFFFPSAVGMVTDFRDVQEALSSIATVRTFGGESYEKKRYEARCTNGFRIIFCLWVLSDEVERRTQNIRGENSCRTILFWFSRISLRFTFLCYLTYCWDRTRLNHGLTKPGVARTESVQIWSDNVRYGYGFVWQVLLNLHGSSAVSSVNRKLRYMVFTAYTAPFLEKFYLCQVSTGRCGRCLDCRRTCRSSTLWKAVVQRPDMIRTVQHDPRKL